MHTIYKYELKLTEYQELTLPENAVILHIGVQGYSICLWAFVDTEADTEQRTFVIKGTGQKFTDDEVDNIRYLETVFLDEFVWHVCEFDG